MLGLAGDTPLEDVGEIPKLVYEAQLQAWRHGPDATPASPLLKGYAAKVGRMARMKAGVDPMPSSPALSADATTLVRVEGSAVIRRMALNLIVNQMMTEEIEVTASNGVVWMARYESVYGTGKRPKDHANCSNAQLCGLEHLKGNDLAPNMEMKIRRTFLLRIVNK